MERVSQCKEAKDEFSEHLALVYWMLMGSKFICLTQIYEWLSMKLIIDWQSKRDFTMAMIDLEEPK
jgi:hypothetical protein